MKKSSLDSHSLYHYTDQDSSFHVNQPDAFNQFYFPLVNESGFLSGITPSLQGDIKLDQHSFLTLPVSIDDLHLSRSARHFWLQIEGPQKTRTLWSVAGRSPEQRADKNKSEKVSVDAGHLWHRLTRTNSKLGIEVSVLNFVPSRDEHFEVMQVTVKNISKKVLSFVPTAAIPIYGRSADNLRDHRHVTSLLNRVQKTKYGVNMTPTMTFNERGHRVNKISYYVVGADQNGVAPIGVFPTVVSLTGENGDLEKPKALLENWKAKTSVSPQDQGKEALGGLQFKTVRLKPGASISFNLFIGVNLEGGDVDRIVKSYGSNKAVEELLSSTKKYWAEELSQVQFKTGDEKFNHWIRWVQTQPILRKIFGCSFLPDFDYGKGGRGWRDLWQDCLALLLSHPEEVREMIKANFAGIRIDGSNATIIGKKKLGAKNSAEVSFIADRNSITRTWMDHGVWPFLTSLLYLNQTGDWNFLLESMPYFRDAQLRRARKLDTEWMSSFSTHGQDNPDCSLKTKSGKTYSGTILEHILVQTLVQFFNVGEHNMIRLEDADWNDGLDMAHERGESVAFTSLYAGNLDALASLLEYLKGHHGWRYVVVTKDLITLFDRIENQVNYDQPLEKIKRLDRYFDQIENGVNEETVEISINDVIKDLTEKSQWMKSFLKNQEWVQSGKHEWFNGYYDNNGIRVEGLDQNGKTKMTLTGQVYPIMSGVADDQQIEKVVAAVNQFLWDKKLGGIRLNTNFGEIQPALGRAFSFAYGEKENGAIFSHMVVMYANALYQRGFSEEGFRVLNSLYTLATKEESSGIYPGLPEYFNNEGRGRYHYLTGSASWYVLTLLTQVFGVRGERGDLLINPKLDPKQFDKEGKAQVSFQFAGVRINILFVNKKKAKYQNWKISSVKSQDNDVDAKIIGEKSALISRSTLQTKKNWNLVVELQ